MPDAASMDTRAASRLVIRERKSVRRTVLGTLLGMLALFVGTAEAGDAQFPSTMPAVVESDAASSAQQASQQPLIRRRLESTTSKLLRATATSADREFAPQPNSIRALMPPFAPAEAGTHDERVGRELPVGINGNGTIETLPKLNLERTHAPSEEIHLQNFDPPKEGLLRSFGVTAANGVVTNNAPPGPASVEELARALRYDPDLIYQYVRNNIEIDPVRGIHKGALGAVIDNYGSAFDQSRLMVWLLLLSGYEARFVKGTIKLSAQQFAGWYGLPTTNLCAVLNLMDQTQIPVHSVSPPREGNCPGSSVAMTSISIEHMWVKANIGGTWFTFDPSYKPHTMKPGVDLNVAAQYNAARFLGGVTGEGWTPGPGLPNPFIGTPDVAGIVDSLSMTSGGINVLAGNLAQWIRVNKPAATLSDVIGGKSIIPDFSGRLRQISNPLLDASWPTEELVDVPIGLKPTVRVLYQGIDQRFTSDAIYGKLLTITYNASHQPVLKLDGQTIGAAGSPVAPGADSVVRFGVSHNAYGSDRSDHAFEQHIRGGGTYLIVNGWGRTGRGLSQNYLKNLENVRAAGNPDNSEAVLGASLGVLGAQWLAQTNASASITERLANAHMVQQHQVGIAGFYQGAYVDLPSNMMSITQMDGNGTLENAVFDSNAMHMSILESTVVAQTSGVSAVSTIKLLAAAIKQGVRIYDSGGGHYATVIKPELRGCEAHLSNFQDYVDQGNRLLIPRDCKMTNGSWNGIGYFVLGDGYPRALGSIISGGFSGGFPTEASSAITYNNAASKLKSPESQVNFGGLDKVRGDPIDMVLGNFLYEHQDVRTGYGDGPDRLNFQRLYSSGMKNQSGPLGKGWTHNYDIRLRTGSDGFLGLGDRLALDAVAAIVEHKVSLDALNDPHPSAQKYLVAVVAQDWLGDQLINNTRTASFGMNSEVFVRLPDGRFSPPPGKPVSLSIIGNTAKYTTLGGGYYTFNLDKVSSYIHPDRRQISFTWSGDLLTRVDNSVGRSLTLAYANNRLQSVSSPQQTVRYAYDGNDNLVSETDPDGFTTRFEYGQPGRMTKFYQPGFPNTAVVSNTYDTLGRVQTQTSAAGNRYDYYFAGSRSEEVGPGGSSHANYFDGEGNLLQIGDSMGNWTIKDYDGQNRLVRETRPEKNRIEYTYLDQGCFLVPCEHNIRTISQFPRPGTNDPVLTQRFTYEMQTGNLATSEDGRGKISTRVYSDKLLIRTTQPVVDGVTPATDISYESVPAVGNDKPAFYRPVRVVEKIDGTRSTTTKIS
ncbi:Rhs family protein [Caballeronia udeis]|uniref:Rhs family protein n=1 Tax=Caballeronia udeis TaxID=1232866 RepID=A0A158GUE3_9BURK|nr:DUF6531 domain-containing protein [Caballeronia udeis]SAL35239.1 Rhs family protein [Caballeronia udeis]